MQTNASSLQSADDLDVDLLSKMEVVQKLLQ